jgi:hypothetical protein
LLWIVLCLMLLSVASSAVHMLELSVVYSFLQEQIDTVTVEGVEIAGREDWIEIKTEGGYIQLVGRVKCEPEVSVLCCVFCVQVCVCVCVFCTANCVQLHTFHTCTSHHFSFCLSTSRCTCVIRSVWSLSVQIITYFLSHLLPTTALCLGQSVLMFFKKKNWGRSGNKWKIQNKWRCQNGIFICVFNITKVMLSRKYCDKSEWITYVVKLYHHRYVAFVPVQGVIKNYRHLLVKITIYC